MPTIDFSKKDLEELMNYKIPEKDLHSFFLPVKGEVDGYENGQIKLDVKDSNRPDLWSVEGVAREMKAHLGTDTGFPKIKISESKYSVSVEGLDKIRPKAAYAIALNVDIDDNFLRSLIQMQEKIAISYGKRRKEVAIGIFDLDKIVGTKLKYKAESKSAKFKALGSDKEDTLENILKSHPKGKEYGFLLEGFDKYPILQDEKGNVLSMPPIINSENSGRVETKTKNLFLDVTGLNQETVNTALLIFCMALQDRGADVQSVEVIYQKEKIRTPYIVKRNIEFDKKTFYEFFSSIKSDDEIVKLLSKKRYETKIVGNKASISYLNYRSDIMHPVDVIEDLLISYGFNQIKPNVLNVQTVGSVLDKTEWINIVREAAMGVGLQEVMTFTLTSKKKQGELIGIKNDFVTIANPMSESIEIFRERILPEHLEFLSKNQHISYPQNIFEVGEVLSTNGKEVFENRALCAVLCNSTATFSEASSLLLSILKNIGAKEIKFTAEKFGFMITGRSAKVRFKLEGIEKEGYIGEIHPQVLKNFNLDMPAVAFEILIDKKN